MGIYTSSKGEKKDTKDMPIEYINRALAKSKQNGDQANIDVLEEEINSLNN
jgi:hypothetical protein